MPNPVYINEQRFCFVETSKLKAEMGNSRYKVDVATDELVVEKDALFNGLYQPVHRR